jgi:hypothetical protein
MDVVFTIGKGGEVVKILIIPFHLWLTTTFNGSTIMTDEALQFLPPGMLDILLHIKQITAANYVRKPLPTGQARIYILHNNLCQHQQKSHYYQL